MVVPSGLLRALRPGVQVPLANACAFAGVAALVMHVVRTAEFFEVAFPVGVALTAVASLVVMRLLFARSSDSHRAFVQAVMWPPLMGACVGAAVDLCLRSDRPKMSLSFLGADLGGGVPETVAVALLSGLAGLLGTAIVLPQVLLVERAREGAGDGGSRLMRAAFRLAVIAWATAFTIASLATLLARREEGAATAVLVVACALGVAGQAARARLASESVTRVAPAAPYR
jgi:hypothetical protein